jgi:hypothetical protein
VDQQARVEFFLGSVDPVLPPLRRDNKGRDNKGRDKKGRDKKGRDRDNMGRDRNRDRNRDRDRDKEDRLGSHPRKL